MKRLFVILALILMAHSLCASASVEINQTLVNIVRNAERRPWVPAPRELESYSLARTLLTHGERAGAVFAVLVQNSKRLTLWVSRYDERTRMDVAHIVGYAHFVSTTGPLESFSERVPLFPIERETPPHVIKLIPHIVKRSNDRNVYVRWPDDRGQGLLFRMVAI